MWSPHSQFLFHFVLSVSLLVAFIVSTILICTPFSLHVYTMTMMTAVKVRTATGSPLLILSEGSWIYIKFQRSNRMRETHKCDISYLLAYNTICDYFSFNCYSPLVVCAQSVLNFDALFLVEVSIFAYGDFSFCLTLFTGNKKNVCALWATNNITLGYFSLVNSQHF